MFSYRNKDRCIQELLQEKFAKQLLYQRDTNRLQQNTRQLQTNAQNQVNRMLVIIARKQTRIGELLREKFVFQLVIRQRDQNILNLQGQILALQNNPLLNMANAHLKRLPLLKILNPNLGKFQSYTGQEPPNKYLDKVIQSWIHLEGYMTLLENVNIGDFNNAYKCEILKSIIGEKYISVSANNGFVAGNPTINTPDTLWAWIRAKY